MKTCRRRQPRVCIGCRQEITLIPTTRRTNGCASLQAWSHRMNCLWSARRSWLSCARRGRQRWRPSRSQWTARRYCLPWRQVTQALGPREVIAGRQRELKQIKNFCVNEMRIASARSFSLKFVRATWFDDEELTKEIRALSGRVQWRTEVNRFGRADVTQTSHPMKSSGAILSMAGSQKNGDGVNDILSGGWDVRGAFFHAPFSGKVTVTPPSRLVQPAMCLLHARGTRRQHSLGPWSQ